MNSSSADEKNPKQWENLADSFANSRQVSADRLIEWPAQLALCGDFKGKTILDLGCGTGDKARFLADQGAQSVLGIDATEAFASHWAGHRSVANLKLVRASFEALADLPEFCEASLFDLVISFQSLMYAEDLAGFIGTVSEHLSPGGALVMSVPHPFRFALLKSELEGWGPGYAYQHTAPYRYPSPWKAEITLKHAMPRVSDYLNAIACSGLRIIQCVEPPVTEELRTKAPEKAKWMERYIGILLIRAEKR